MINILESLDLLENMDRIVKKFKDGDGGKGGAFMYFTYDNRLVIKTMNEEELKTFKQTLPFYYMHM